MKNDEIDLFFPLFNFVLIEKSYAADVSIVLRWTSLALLECKKVSQRYSFGWILAYITAYVMFVFVLYFACVLALIKLFETIEYIRTENFVSIYTCNHNDRHLYLHENKTVPTKVHEIYKVRNTESSGCIWQYTITTPVSDTYDLRRFQEVEEYHRSLNEDVTLKCSFTCSPYRKYLDRFPLIWRYRGQDIATSYKYNIVNKTWPLPKPYSGHMIDSNLTINALEENDFGEYRCVAKVLDTCSDGISTNVCDYVDSKTQVLYRYVIKKQEKMPVRAIPVPVGNSLFVTWCNIDIAIEDPADMYFSLYHTVDGRSVDLNQEENDFCSIISWSYHSVAYFLGLMKIHPPKKFMGVYTSTDIMGSLRLALHTCTYEDKYGRDFYNSSSKSVVLLELEHPQEILIVPEAPYIAANVSGDMWSCAHGLSRLSRNDIIVYYLRIVLEYVILICLYLYTIRTFISVSQKFDEVILQKYILEQKNTFKSISKSYKIAVLCCESDRAVWMNFILENLEKTHNKSVFFVHRDFEDLAGRSKYDLYLQMYDMVECLVLHITKYFLEDEDCLQFQFELLLAHIKEKKTSVTKVLVIHGDNYVLPDKLILSLPDVEIHDWVLTKNDDQRAKDILKWLDMAKLETKSSQAERSSGQVNVMLL